MLCLWKKYIINKRKGRANQELRRSGVQRVDNDDSQNVEIFEHAKTKDEESLIKMAIQSNEFISNLFKRRQLNRIVAAMYSKNVLRDEIIIQQGDHANNMYVSASGAYEIIINGESRSIFSDSRIFGELALLYNTTRLATVKATMPGKVWILDRNVYQKIRMENVKAEKEEMLSFLENVPGLNSISRSKLEEILVLLEDEFYTTDTDIIKQGEKGDKFYIVKTGTASVNIEGQGKVATLGRGKYFGERALIQNDIRQATVTADQPGIECLSLSRLNFKRFLSNVESFLSYEGNPSEEVEILECNEYSNLELFDLKRVVTIGQGGFGRVELVQHKRQKNIVFALKYLVKDNVIQRNMKHLAIMEKQIHMSCKNDFIVRMYKSYQDTKYLYFLMESCLGGDLWYLRTSQKHSYFTEMSGKFLAACVLEALAYLHQRKIVFLDLKPENILIDSQGYAKLTDFGNAMHIKNSKDCYLFMGTPDYVAPEVIFQKGYDLGADYWAFGILIFELLVGKSPFATNDPTYMQTYQKIIKGIDYITFPDRISKHAECIIKQLCKSNRSQRLGTLANGADDIRSHEWFSSFSWKSLISRKMKSPFKIKLRSSTDTRYFKNKFDEDYLDPPACDIWEDF